MERTSQGGERGEENKDGQCGGEAVASEGYR